ncbi:hypothetical protein E1B28_010929 [Marasmius oreades]|nr:uncharacterized protein E1B28_010929 [Marasmius oreades]KAG7089229.1 hypothetical protein E1B28_010929 [Marasmius oreades]
MLSYFYDVRHKDDFAYAFRYSEDMSTWMPNNHYVLKLEFGSLDVKSQDFNLNDELNKALEDFVKQYSLLPEGKEWKELEDKDPVTTLSNVMSVTRPRKHGLVVLVDDYDSPFWAAYEFPDKRDEIKRSLYKFFGALLCWKRCQVISVIFFTGTQQILSTVSEATWEEAHDIVVQEDTDKLAGFCREDVFYIANVMQWTFHGLRLAELADEFLESEEAKEQLEQGAGWYEFSCHTVLDFFHKRLAEKGKAVTGYVPLRTEQRIVNSPIFP